MSALKNSDEIDTFTQRHPVSEKLKVSSRIVR